MVLLAYPFMIAQICMAGGVLELPRIKEMIKARQTFDIGLIKDISNPLAQLMRQATNMFVGIFVHGDQIDTPALAAAPEVESQTEGVHTDAVGTSSAPSLVQSMPYRPWGMPFNIIMISHTVWTKVVTKLAMLDAKVTCIEGGVRNWLDRRLDK